MESASRFAHLLQPIKDMSKIWNIPIAAELESYLDELEQMTQMDPDEAIQKMNFAEAALLVQGSANIFGRKVELLYELAYHALDLIVSDRKDDKGPKRKGVYSAGLWGPIPDEMETIDHLIKEGRGIEIEDGAMPNRASAMRRVPLWLMPREATDRRRHEFRITSCAVHRTGCHLLQESDATELDKLLAENRVQRDGTEPLAPAPPEEIKELDDDLQALLCLLPPDQRVGLEEDEEVIAKDIEVGEEPDVPLEEEAQDMEEDDMEVAPPTPVQDMPAPNTPLATPVRLSVPGMPENAGLTGHDFGLPLAPGVTPLRHSIGPNGEPIAQKDPWELLDEHDGSHKESKVVTGKCFKKPGDRLLVSLQDLPDPDQIPPLTDEARWHSDASGVASMSVGGHPVEALFKAMRVVHSNTARCEAQRLGFSGIWLEGEDLLADAMRKRARQRAQRAAQERLEIKARARVGVGGGGSAGGLLGKNGAGDAGSESSDTEEEQDPKLTTPMNTPGKDLSRLSIDTMGKTPGKEGDEEEKEEEQKNQVVTEADLKMVEQRKEVARLEGAIEAAQRKYEATIREYLERTNRALMDHSLKRMPELYANVRAWQDMLEPVLKEQHKRPDFDIFNYGQDMLVAMGPEGGTPVPFSVLCEGLPRWEVCRRFLTILVLTNHGNTDIVVYRDEEKLNGFSLQLINAKKDLPSLQDDPDEDKKKQKDGKGKKGSKPLAEIADQKTQETLPIAADDVAVPDKAATQGQRQRKKARVGKEN